MAVRDSFAFPRKRLALRIELFKHGETILDFLDHQLDILSCGARDGQQDIIG